MGAIYDSFERELDVWSRRFAESPRDEMIQLCLTALEREELVTVGYREDLMLRRLASMKVTHDVHEIVHHALVWAWNGEEMHSIYIRGALLRLGNWTLRANTFTRQMAGAIAVGPPRCVSMCPGGTLRFREWGQASSRRQAPSR